MVFLEYFRIIHFLLAQDENTKQHTARKKYFYKKFTLARGLYCIMKNIRKSLYNTKAMPIPLILSPNELEPLYIFEQSNNSTLVLFTCPDLKNISNLALRTNLARCYVGNFCKTSWYVLSMSKNVRKNIDSHCISISHYKTLFQNQTTVQ